MSWVLTSSGAITRKAGAGANTTITASSVALSEWVDMAEGQINSLTLFDWTTKYSSLGTYYKQILSDAVSDCAAMKVINYDMSGYTSRTEAQTMLDVLRDNMNRCVEALKDAEVKDKMGAI